VLAGKRLPERTAAYIAAALFVIFGTTAIVRAILLLAE
jgi:putative Ca2+/H+ antiporter (TMEM165/GDT1 family)